MPLAPTFYTLRVALFYQGDWPSRENMVVSCYCPASILLMLEFEVRATLDVDISCAVFDFACLFLSSFVRLTIYFALSITSSTVASTISFIKHLRYLPSGCFRIAYAKSRVKTRWRQYCCHVHFYGFSLKRLTYYKPLS